MLKNTPKMAPGSAQIAFTLQVTGYSMITFIVMREGFFLLFVFVLFRRGEVKGKMGKEGNKNL